MAKTKDEAISHLTQLGWMYSERRGHMIVFGRGYQFLALDSGEGCVQLCQSNGYFLRADSGLVTTTGHLTTIIHLISDHFLRGTNYQ